MKNIIFLLGLFILFNNEGLFSQNNKSGIKWGTAQESSRLGGIPLFLGAEESDIYVETGKDGYTIQKFNKSLTPVQSFTFEQKDPTSKEKFNYEGSIHFNNKITLFKSTVNMKEMTRTLYMQEISPKTMAAKSQAVKIGEMSFKHVLLTKSTVFAVSENKERVLVLMTKLNKDLETEIGRVIMLDKDLKILWSSEIKLPFEPGLFSFNEIRCDDSGNAYVIGKLYNGKVKITDGSESDFSWHLLSISENGSNLKDYKVNISQKFISGITFRVINNNLVCLAGFYSNTNRTSVNGSFFYTINPGVMEVITSSKNEFEIGFVTEGMTMSDQNKENKKESKGKEIELPNCKLQNMIIDKDGNIYLIGEQNYTRSYQGTSSTSFMHQDFKANDIFIINYKPDGKISWSRKILKAQKSSDWDYNISFSYFYLGNKFHFLFNDNPDNAKVDGSIPVKNYNPDDMPGVIMHVSIDSTGNQTREILSDNKEAGIIFCPEFKGQINENSMFIFGKMKKSERYGLINF